MKELEVLLDQFWIVKSQNKDLFYTIKDHFNEFKSFIMDKLGYHFIMNQDVIKIEKLPGIAEPWMGLRSFDSQMEYAFLCLLLMFLEDKGKEEQFILSSVSDFIQSYYPGPEKIDWTQYQQRRHLIKVIKFAESMGLIKVDDGDDQKFIFDVETEALYESTGLSRYFVRNFTSNIMNYTSFKNFEKDDWDINSDKGVIRRQRVYRRLIMSPIVYNDGMDDVDYDYIKKQRSYISNDLEHYLNYELHIHKNGALVVLNDDQYTKEMFPNNKAISDITLLFNRLICQKLQDGEIKVEVDDKIYLSKSHFGRLVEELRDVSHLGWSKEYREMNFEKLEDEIISFMQEYKMIMVDDLQKVITLMPVVGKLTGKYPDDYNHRDGDESNE